MPLAKQEMAYSMNGDGYTDFKDLEIGTYLRGIVSYIDDPTSFYLQFENPDKKNFYCLQRELQQELRDFKNETEVNVNNLMRGQCYAASKDGVWCRVLLEKFTSDGVCHVFYLDDGLRQALHASNLKYISNRFLILPPQAVLCQLHGIYPGTENENFVSAKALATQQVTIFVEKVYAGQVGRFLEGESVLHVTVYVDDDRVSFNTRLVQAGYMSEVGQHEQPWHFEVLNSFQTSTSGSSMDSVSTTSGTFSERSDISNNLIAVTAPSHWLVTVSHIVDPGKFFVHFQHVESKLKKLRALLSNPRIALPRADDIQTNSVYAVRTDSVQHWQRGKCLGKCGFVVQTGSIETCYEFHLIDHGSTEKVVISCIRQLPEQLLEYPSLAVQCSLGLETPKKGWPPSVIEQFQTLTKQRSLQMTVTEVAKSALIVDLAELTDSSKAVASFRKMVKGPQVSQIFLKAGQFRHQWINQSKGTRLVGRVLRVSHPCAFYVRFLESVYDSFPAYQSELQEEMDKLNARSNLAVQNPRPGTAYAFRHNGSWHRVLLEEMNPANGDARIFCVDNGLRVSVAISHLRQLPERFTEHPAQVMWCKLCNIRPSAGDDWSEKSRQFFREKISDAFVTVYIASSLPGSVGKAGTKEYTYFVYLYVDGARTSVNSLLVKQGHADATGPLEQSPRS